MMSDWHTIDTAQRIAKLEAERDEALRGTG
jgi:hypothetical protein